MRKTILALITFLFLSLLFAPPSLAATDLPIKEMTCLYPVRIYGNSMEPRFREGQRVMFNKCIDEIRDNLSPETPVLFQRQGRQGLSVAVIREKINRPEGVFYSVSSEGEPERKEEISSQQIVGVYQPKDRQSSLTEEEQKALADFKSNPLIALGGLITTFIFWGAILYWRRKTGVGWRFFGAAVLVWGAMFGVKTLMDLELPPSRFVPGLTLSSLGGILAIFLYYGLRTGLTENGFSYLYIKKKLKEASFNEAVAFGIAFNGVEALMVGLWTFAAGLVLFLKPKFLDFFPPHLRMEVVQAFGGPALYIPAQWIERSAVLLGGLFASLLVFATIRTGKWRYFWLAVIYKMVVDGGLAVYLTRYSNPPAGGFVLWAYLVQVPAIVYGIVGLLGTHWIKRVFFSAPVKKRRDL